MKRATFDADEYFHLALHASAESDPHACIAYLEEVLEREPRNARAIYLLAVQHSELGLTPRAMSGVEAALAIEPGLEIARFHLGMLLLLDPARTPEARQHLANLGSSTDSRLRSYAEALLALADGDNGPAREKLQRVAGDQPLAAFMKRLFEHLSAGP
jgi:tetratricopeptide (TPR) repeat protein